MRHVIFPGIHVSPAVRNETDKNSFCGEAGKLKKVLAMWIIFLTILFIHVVGIQSADDSWDGKWFPSNPNLYDQKERHGVAMGLVNSACDDGETNLKIDFDPNDLVDVLQYVCSENPSLYKQNYSVQPVLKEYIIPSHYVALHKCMNESINYPWRLPTYGTHRPLWPKYGEYKFLPVQRWLHSLEHGAIVMLYHPCSNYREVKKLKTLVRSCLYRHIISPSKILMPDRPLALVAWGRSLEMSIVEEPLVISFIKNNALKGPENISKEGQYDKDFLKHSEIVSDIDDSHLCPNF